VCACTHYLVFKEPTFARLGVFDVSVGFGRQAATAANRSDWLVSIDPPSRPLHIPATLPTVFRGTF